MTKSIFGLFFAFSFKTSQRRKLSVVINFAWPLINKKSDEIIHSKPIKVNKQQLTFKYSGNWGIIVKRECDIRSWNDYLVRDIRQMKYKQGTFWSCASCHWLLYYWSISCKPNLTSLTKENTRAASFKVVYRKVNERHAICNICLLAKQV